MKLKEDKERNVVEREMRCMR